MFNENMIRQIQKIINSIENFPTTFWFWLAAFSSIIIVRLLIENWLAGFQNRSGLFLFYEFTHTFLFFLISYILFAILINGFLKVAVKKAANALLWGFLIIITPPILDYIISGGKGYWSFYKFDSLTGLIRRFFTFFGDKPEIGITYGVRIEVAVSLIFIFIYSAIKLLSRYKSQFPNPNFQQKSKSQNDKFGNLNVWDLIGNWKLEIGNLIAVNKFIIFIKSPGITLFAYIIFFVLGTFPSHITILFKGFSEGFLSITGVDIAQMFLTPAKIFSREIPDVVSSLNIKMSLVYSLILIGIVLIGLLFYQKEKILVFIKNARYPQLIYHGGLLLVGMGLAYISTGAAIEINFFNVISFLVLLSSVLLAWLASVTVNDLADQKIDKITNADRPLIREKFSPAEYQTMGWIFFLTSILLAAIVNFKIALLLIIYQTVAWLYSCPPLRLKRFAFISTFVSSIASLMILFSGYILISPEQNISGLPFSLTALLIIGCTFALPVKDFKDIAGDKKEKVYTIPVLFGEEWGRIVVGSGVFASFVLSAVILNEIRMFWWSVVFGSVSFWMIFNKKINPRRLLWLIFAITFFYGLILVKVAFF